MTTMSSGTPVRPPVRQRPAAEATPVPVRIPHTDAVPPDAVRTGQPFGVDRMGGSDPGHWVSRGYVVVNADLRGWGKSDGAGELFSDQEGLDCHDLIEWAAMQPWSNHRVGMSGVSYSAISQWAAAATRPPHLAAICPWEGFTDFYRDFARPGGVLENGFLSMWTIGLR